MLTQQQEPSKAYVLAGIFTLSLRLIVGWTYFSAFGADSSLKTNSFRMEPDTLEKSSIISFPIPLVSNRLLNTWSAHRIYFGGQW